MLKKMILTLLVVMGMLWTGSAQAEILINYNSADSDKPLQTEKAVQLAKTEIVIEENENNVIVKTPFEVALGEEDNTLKVVFEKSFAKVSKEKNKGICSLKISQEGRKHYMLAPYIGYKSMDINQLQFEVKEPKEKKRILEDKKHPLHKVRRSKMVKIDMQSENWEQNGINFSRGYIDLNKYDKVVDALENAVNNKLWMRWEICFWDGGANEILWMDVQEIEKLLQVMKYELAK